MTNNKNNKDSLVERKVKFEEEIINFAKKNSENSLTKLLISQLVVAGTIIGVNDDGTDDTENRKESKHKIGIGKKEARETKFWLRTIAVNLLQLKEEVRKWCQESKELKFIFKAIIHSVKTAKEIN